MVSCIRDFCLGSAHCFHEKSFHLLDGEEVGATLEATRDQRLVGFDDLVAPTLFPNPLSKSCWPLADL